MDGWRVKLSDSTEHRENWLEGYLSPWQRLMIYCKDNRCYIEQMGLNLGTRFINLPSNADGYWQAHAANSLQSRPEEDYFARAVGWVEQNNIRVVWGTYFMDQPIFWEEVRKTEGQHQIIYANIDNKELVCR